MAEVLPHERQILEYMKTIDHLKRQNKESSLFGAEIKKLEAKVEKLKSKVYSELTPWERIQISRHPDRPRAIDYIHEMCDEFHELSGDRAFGEDAAIIGGFAKIGDFRCMILGQEKGSDTESRLKRNFGMMHPEGYRKALRLMRMAEKFQLPIVTLLDTPGAFPGLGAEERGQGWAIAENLRAMSRLSVPIVVLVIGEGCSGGALGIGVGDRIGMLEHAYYSVISPEGCASILWKEGKKNKEAASALKLNAENLIEYGIIDEVIQEPAGGAHKDQAVMIATVKAFVIEQLNVLREIPKDLLLKQRYMKFREMGQVAV